MSGRPCLNIEQKLKDAKCLKVSKSFTPILMTKVTEEFRIILEERKSDKIAKYIIACFTLIIVIIAFMAGYLFQSDSSSQGATWININPLIETLSSYFQRFIGFVELVFMKLLETLGLPSPAYSISYLLGLITVICLFLLSDRIFLSGKLKSTNRQM